MRPLTSCNDQEKADQPENSARRSYRNTIITSQYYTCQVAVNHGDQKHQWHVNAMGGQLDARGKQLERHPVHVEMESTPVQQGGGKYAPPFIGMDRRRLETRRLQ